jgi:Na+-driven multidrug efflux pump
MFSSFINRENLKLLRQMVRNALPLALGGLLSVLMGFIDAVYLSAYSLDAFKALSLIIPILGIVGSIGIGIGAALINSLASGNRGNTNNSIYYSNTLLTVGFFFIIVVMVVLGHDPFARFNDLTKPVNRIIFNFFTLYWHAVIPVYALLLVLNISTQYLSFRNQNKEILLILFIIVISNLIFNPICIFYLNLGVVGAAIASFISLFLGLLYFALKQNRYRKIIYLLKSHVKYLKYAGAIIKAQLKITISVSLAIAIFAIGSIFFNQLAIREGNEFLAFIGFIEQLKLLMIFPTRGVTGAFLIMFEKKIASRKVAEYWPVYWASTFIIGFICLVEATTIYLTSDILFEAFNFSGSGNMELLQRLLVSLFIYFAVSIFPRSSQVGFITLGKSYLLLLQSFFSILLGYMLTWYMVNFLGKEWFIDGQSIGIFIATSAFLIWFVVLLKKRIKYDKQFV